MLRPASCQPYATAQQPGDLNFGWIFTDHSTWQAALSAGLLAIGY